MKKGTLLLLGLALATFGCAGTGYNTQKGAVIGAGVGALAGQAIGHDTESTLIGTGVGALVGTITGNAVDQYTMYPGRYPYYPAQPFGAARSGGCGHGGY